MTPKEYRQEAKELQPKLIEVALRFLRHKEDAEDIVQDVFAKLWGMLEDLHPPMAALACVLTRNFCIDRIRRSTTLAELDAPDEARLADISSEPNQAQGEMIERMMQIIDFLPPKQQLVLRLRHMDGMDNKYIAQLMGLSEANVRQILCRARQGVRAIYLEKLKKR